MPLPVLNVPNRRPDGDLLRLFRRTESLLADSLAETTPLQSGSALTNRNYPDIAAANRMLDGAIPAGWSAEQAIAEVNAHFAAHGVRCREWWPNGAEAAEPLASALISARYAPQAVGIYSLASPARPPDRPGPALSVYSARAALRHAQSLAEEMTAHLPHASEEAEAFVLHLDDPHFELLLATDAGEPIGMVGVFAAGDIGRIEPIFVRESHRGQGIDQLLLDRAIELSARTRFADVLVGMPAASDESLSPLSLFTAAGFRGVGTQIIYRQN